MAGSSFVIINIVMSYVGAGVLGLPYGFKHAGLLLGPIILALVCVCVVYSMHILVDCKNRARSMILSEADTPITHSDIAHLAFGYVGEIIMQLAILLSQLGFSSAYLLFICDNLISVIPSMTKLEWIAILLPLLYLLTFVKNLERFVVFSFLSQLANLAAFLVIIGFDIASISKTNANTNTATIRNEIEPMSLSGVFMFYSICIYSFEGSGLILSLENTGDIDTQAKFKRNFSKSVVAITTFYAFFGALGFLAFGEATQQIITLNLPHTSGFDFALMVKLCLCFSLFFSYPLMLHPLSCIFDDKVAYCMPPLIAKFVLRLLLVSTTGLVIILLPNFADLLEILGSICCTILAFIIPALAHLKLFRGEMSKKEVAGDLVLVLVGGLTVVAGCLDTYRKLTLTSLA